MRNFSDSGTGDGTGDGSGSGMRYPVASRRRENVYSDRCCIDFAGWGFLRRDLVGEGDVGRVSV